MKLINKWLLFLIVLFSAGIETESYALLENNNLRMPSLLKKDSPLIREIESAFDIDEGIQLYVFDFDGTLVSDWENISYGMLAEIILRLKRGKKIAVLTGGSPGRIHDFFGKHIPLNIRKKCYKEIIFSGNMGTQVGRYNKNGEFYIDERYNIKLTDDEKQTVTDVLREEVKKIYIKNGVLNEADELDDKLFISNVDDYRLVTGGIQIGLWRPGTITLWFKDEYNTAEYKEQVYSYFKKWKKQNASYAFLKVSTSSIALDIAPIDKGEALDNLLHLFRKEFNQKIEYNNVVVCGDSANDYEMLEKNGVKAIYVGKLNKKQLPEQVAHNVFIPGIKGPKGLLLLFNFATEKFFKEKVMEKLRTLSDDDETLNFMIKRERKSIVEMYQRKNSKNLDNIEKYYRDKLENARLKLIENVLSVENVNKFYEAFRIVKVLEKADKLPESSVTTDFNKSRMRKLGQKDFAHLSRYNYIKDHLLEKEDRVLDLGCGDGYGSLILANNCKFVTGIDFDQGAIAAANAKKIKKAQKNVEFIDGSAGGIKFLKNNSVDKVVCIEVIEHIYDREGFLEEIYRVLKPGGKLIITAPYYPYGNSNPTHIVEFSKKSFEELISIKFNIKNWFGQGKNKAFIEINKLSKMKHPSEYEKFVYIVSAVPKKNYTQSFLPLTISDFKSKENSI